MGRTLYQMIYPVPCVSDFLSEPMYKLVLIMIAGHGAALNTDGEVELDAIIMDGRTLASGAVSSVKNIANPVSLARAVMEKVLYFIFVYFKETARDHWWLERHWFRSFSNGKQLLCKGYYPSITIFWNPFSVWTFSYMFAPINNFRHPTSCWQAEVQTCLQRALAWPQFPLIHWWLSMRGESGRSTRIMLLEWWRISTLSGKYLYFDPFYPGLRFPHISLQSIFSGWIAWCDSTLKWNKININSGARLAENVLI